MAVGKKLVTVLNTTGNKDISQEAMNMSELDTQNESHDLTGK